MPIPHFKQHRQECLFHVGAGPGPVFGAAHETCRHGIAFDVPDDSLQLGIVANPAIVRFVLPERLAGAVEEFVCFARRVALDGLCDSSKRNVGLQEHMDVIRHDDVRAQFAQPQLVLHEAKGFDDGTRDSRIPQPHGANTGTIELTIHEDECAAG